MNLRQIEVFHAVYSAGSISAASRLLNVSQPSVSKVVKHTETCLGFSLFRLVRGRLAPTDEAHALFREVDELHKQIAVFQRTARNLRTMAEGHLRLGVLPSLSFSVTPASIARFRSLAPRVTVDVRALHHDEFRAVLTSRECDFVIGHHLLQDPDIAGVSVGQGRVGALMSRGMAEDENGEIDLETLQRHEVIRFSPSVAIADLVGQAAYKLAADAGRSVVAHSVYIAAALAKNGVGVAIVDEFTAQGFVSPDLCFRPVKPAVTFELKALHLVRQPLSRISRAFLDVQRQVIADGLPTDAPAL
ncbi:LysR family transcriptional regulator [Novosphingobium album (ex Liu et al. 2023)]|uniref:LysR family transcriptional regulator n=1 Tax=Novosphingobium album (ex Liu et al. 2023) TaxID=3031130 RepID=A0ABT5WR73_9SPHN|nr:LysR family transcriptional regulator [Novosphingobium album (ex Liu et al. 2023)]MDE8652534.1 LysR family transcriptional regulator [Novosphingobium album (ex Liu et al. 2023)]